MLLGGASFTACTETNDWDVDPAYDRLFHSSKVSVSPGEDQAEVTFKKMPDAEFYVIEISTDTLFDEVETTEHSIYFGDKEDARITTSPYTMTGLEGSTKYYSVSRAALQTARALHGSILMIQNQTIASQPSQSRLSSMLCLVQRP